MSFESDISLQKRLAPLHLIGACLIAGVVAFAGVALTVGPLGGAVTAPPTVGSTSLSMPMLMRIMCVVLAVVQIPLAFIIRRPFISRAAVIRRSGPGASATSAGLDSNDDVHGPTFDAFRTASIISLALLESVALLGGIAVMFSGDPIDLLLVGVPVLVMLAVFPTTGRWRAFDRAVQERAAIGR